MTLLAITLVNEIPCCTILKRSKKRSFLEKSFLGFTFLGFSIERRPDTKLRTSKKKADIQEADAFQLLQHETMFKITVTTIN